MESALLDGDSFMVQTFPRHAPQRSDIVAFFYPVDRKQTFVKRIVGVPGDHFTISKKALYINSSRLDDPYVVHKRRMKILTEIIFQASLTCCCIPPGRRCYRVMSSIETSLCRPESILL